MFTKKFYTTLRFYAALVVMFSIPLVFVIMAFVVVVAIPKEQDDPPRLLSLNNSGSNPKNVTLFYADLVGDVLKFSVS